VAGKLTLNQVTVFGTDGATALPRWQFGYASQTEYYEDGMSGGSINCGPAWNTGTGNGCLLWSQSYAGNSYYLATASNGQGLATTFTWQNARGNVHGANSGAPADIR